MYTGTTKKNRECQIKNEKCKICNKKGHRYEIEMTRT